MPSMEPASTIIKICGGAYAVAELTGLVASSVYRWTYAKHEGGTGGVVPADAASKLMVAARTKGLPLTAEHFFPTDGVAP